MVSWTCADKKLKFRILMRLKITNEAGRDPKGKYKIVVQQANP